MGSKLETLPGSTSSTNSSVMECSRIPEDGYILKTSLSSQEVHVGRWSSSSPPSSDADVRKLGVSRSHFTFKAASLPSLPAYKQFSVPLQHKMLVNSQNSEKTDLYASQSMTGDALGKLWAGMVRSFPTLSLLVHDCIRDSLKLAHASLLGSFSELLLSESSSAGMEHRLRVKPYPTPLMHSLFLLRGYHFPVAVDYISEPSDMISGCASEERSSPHLSSMSPEVVKSSADAGRSEQTSASPGGSCELYLLLLRNDMHNGGCLEAESPRKYQKEECIVNDNGADIVSSLPTGKLSDNTADVNFNFGDQNDIHGPINDVPDSQDEMGDSDEEDVDIDSISNVDPGEMKSVGEGGTSWGWGSEDEGLADVTCDWWRKCEEIRGEVEDEDTVWEDENDDSDGETEVDRVADELWKSFEDSALSPVCSSMKPPRPSEHREHAPSAELCALLTPQQLEVPLQQTTAEPIKTTTVTSVIHVHEQAEMVSDISTSGLSRSAADDAYICPKSTLCRQTKKRVHFPEDSKLSTVYRIVAWNFAYRAARRGPWEQFARDRAHFRRRIEGVASVLEPCLAARRAATFGTECVTC